MVTSRWDASDGQTGELKRHSKYSYEYIVLVLVKSAAG